MLTQKNNKFLLFVSLFFIFSAFIYSCTKSSTSSSPALPFNATITNTSSALTGNIGSTITLTLAIDTMTNKGQLFGITLANSTFGQAGDTAFQLRYPFTGALDTLRGPTTANNAQQVAVVSKANGSILDSIRYTIKQATTELTFTVNSVSLGNGTIKNNGIQTIKITIKPISFANQIQPLLNTCGQAACHSVATMSGGLALTNYSNISQNSGSLVNALNGTGVTRMPKGGPYFSSEQIALVSTWVQQGAQNN